MALFDKLLVRQSVVPAGEERSAIDDLGSVSAGCWGALTVFVSLSAMNATWREGRCACLVD